MKGNTLKSGNLINGLLALSLVALLATAAFADKAAPSTEDQIHGLQTMCAETADARVARQEEESLYLRLGGYDKILELTTEIVRLHSINPAIVHTLDGVDHANLAKHVADFAAAGTGGDAKYTGRSLPASHAHLKLTDADFLAAGSDVVTAMTSMGYGENEINEFLCILVSLKDQVVFK